MECPNCKAVSTEGAARCICGYDFATKTVDSGAVTTASRPESAATYKLFDSQSVYIASFLGSPLAGSILMSRNYRLWGLRGAAFWTVVGGLAVTFLPIPLIMRLPEPFVGGILIALGTGSVARWLQGKAVEEHVRRGGSLASRWLAAGVGCIGLAAFSLALFVYYFQKLNAKVMIGRNDSVLYSGRVTARDAKALGQRLKDIGYFTDSGASVEVSKDDNGEAVAFVVKDGVWNQPSKVLGLEIVGLEVAPAAGGLPLRLRIDNSQSQIEKELTIDEALIGAKDQVAYSAPATQDEAKALGQALTASGYLSGQGGFAMLSKNGGTIVSLVVPDGAWDKPDLVAYYEKMIRDNASTVGGLPIKVRLVNTPNLDTKLEVPLN